MAIVLFWKKTLYSPKIALPILVIAFIPIIQFLFGQVFFLQNAVLPSLFICATWFALSTSYSLTLAKAPNTKPSEGFMYCFALTMIAAGVISCIVAIIQWLHLDLHTRLVLNLVSDRPYANIGQPNLFATSLIMSVLSVLYLYEKYKIKTILAVLLGALLLFTMSLTLSRTAWLASIVIVLFLLVKAKSSGFRLQRRYMLLWFALFMGCFWILPYLNHLVAEYIAATPKFQMRSMADRTGSGFERFEMWNQIFHAVLQQPWTGYGWYQTTAAQYAVAGQFPVHVWLTSSHNIIIDLLAWNGLLLGGCIIVYFFFFLLILFQKAKTVTAGCAILMMFAVLIHALLEYPLYYAYYLIPVACLSGVILAQQTQPKNQIRLSRWVPRIGFIAGIIFMACTCYFYSQPTPPAKALGQSTHSWQLRTWSLFDKLDTRTQWVRLKPATHLSPIEIEHYRHVVQCYLTHYDMYKFAQVLAYNGDQQGAIELLGKINAMYNKKYTYSDLLNTLKEKSSNS
ncbi:hypothetical protein F4V57_12360 [Acinetobacter qingfengensis]|uniref:PglL family O-oligosaccharyltransferase n=1 Tax=Acinetobacter qingfengensis TaxID=1262585 RepID=UPI00114CDE88|nr:O-antigen ligase family protein [Acinetobacter qingfengensis]KAA8731702.1 hypothetical protein F4V57_12360 [Acinetobacter qingfengensis]